MVKSDRIKVRERRDAHVVFILVYS